MIRRRIKLIAAAAALAVGIGLAGPVPAMANTVSGPISCAVGYRPWIRTQTLQGSVGGTQHTWSPGADKYWGTTGSHTSSPGIDYRASTYSASAQYIYLDAWNCAQNPVL